jgi:ABC-type transport system involved in multi-copper enzyme maturation permease subunit
MNVQTIKEIRSLGPFWLAAILLPMLPLLFYCAGVPHSGEFAGFMAMLSCALLACASFSTEWNTQTMDLMLAQPVSRRQIWRGKMRVLFLALLTLVPAIFASLLGPEGESPMFIKYPLFALGVLVVPIVWAMGVGPYASLILGNGIAAFVFTLFTPGIWIGGVSLLLPGHLDLGETAPNFYLCLFILPLLLMGAVGYRMGKTRFLNLQTSGFVNTTIRLPEWFPWIGHSHATATTPTRLSGGAWRKLLAKEFRLHEVSYIIAGFMILASGLLLAYQPIYNYTVPEPRDHEIILNLIIVVVFVCGLIIPFTVGATTVAEERQMGVLDWHLTLPPSHRKQWFIKMTAAYAHCIVLGIVVPFVVGMGARFLLSPAGTFAAEMNAVTSSSEFTRQVHQLLLMAFSVAGSSLLLCTLAMVASSLARTSMRALVLTMEMTILTGVLVAIGSDLKDTLADQSFSLSVSLGLHYVLFAALCLVLLLSVIFGFNYLNYRRLEPPLGTAIQVVIVSVVAAFIIGIPFLIAKAMEFESQRQRTGLSLRAYTAWRAGDQPELVLKEINAALDQPKTVQKGVYALFSNNYRDLPEAQAIAHRTLTNADPNVRILGINALSFRLMNNGDTNSAEYRQIVTDFEKILRDPHPYVRFIVARSLASKGLDLEQCIAEFTRQVCDLKISTHTRHQMVDALKDLGPKAKSAVPALIQAFNMTPDGVEKNKMFRSVSEALTKIDPTALSQLKPVAGSEESSSPTTQRRYGLPPSQEP